MVHFYKAMSTNSAVAYLGFPHHNWNFGWLCVTHIVICLIPNRFAPATKKIPGLGVSVLFSTDYINGLHMLISYGID